MNILFSSDDNYAYHLMVSIKSILIFNDKCINFYVFDLGISTENKNIILQMINSSKSNIVFIPVDVNDFRRFPKNIGYISLETYARLKAVDYLPSDVNKIIYLDIDTLVFDDLTPLWETNIENYGVAACFDSFVEYEIPEHKYTISLSSQHYYFNAGVMIFNLDIWREIDVFNSSLDWLKKHGEKAIYQDQDILNGIFEDNVYYLDCRFNFMPNQLERIRRYQSGKLVVLNNIEKTTMPVAISHFCGPEKPWHSNCHHFKMHYYYNLLSKIKAVKSDKLPISLFIRSVIRDFKRKLKYKIY